LGAGNSGRGRMQRKDIEGEYGEILYTHVYKWKMTSDETTPGMRRDKGE
jgi:hypothetical protein